MRTAGASNWTPELEDELRVHWASGAPASKIAAMMGGGLTRNSIIGKASRLGLDHRRSPILPRLEPGEARARRNELQRQRRANAPKQPKVRKPALPRRAKKVIVPRRVVYQPDTGASDAELVQGWLAMNGPRRFERGASGDEMAMRSYLHARGYETTYRQGKLYLIGRGRPRLLTYKDLVAFVDEIRVSEGLQRIAA
jgi:hypothetical protein